MATSWTELTEYIIGWDTDGTNPYVILYGGDDDNVIIHLGTAEDLYEVQYLIQNGRCRLETKNGGLWVDIAFADGENTNKYSGVRVDGIAFWVGIIEYPDGRVTASPMSSYTIRLCDQDDQVVKVSSPSSFKGIRLLYDGLDTEKPYYFYPQYKQIGTSRLTCPQR